ncbi:MAG: ribonuclease J [Lachnospiraceae bacterium]|nr:ribonuclease J [Lachnospiraceae bacterium]
MRKRKQNSAKLKVIPLGGLDRIGMNMTAFQFGDSIIVVDCGLAFPENDMLGIDFVIPDISFLKENESKIKGFVITHGHEDHIGAVPYVFKELKTTIYSTRLTMALIERKLEEHGMMKTVKRRVIKYGQTITLGDFRVEFIKTNHSIQDAAALAINTPAGTVIHTGDFKVDYTPVYGDAIDLQRFAELGKKGVLALMCDSTNAERPGFTMSEKTVGAAFDRIFTENKRNRLIIATFASNVDRVQQVINMAVKHKRKVCLEGRSMTSVIGAAIELGYIDDSQHTVITLDELDNYPPEKVVLVTTGSQGEAMAALSRMAANIHKKVKIMPGDVVVFSSHPIPGNEKAVSNVVNELYEIGARVVLQDTHVSGHACQEDIKLIYALTAPKYTIPVHGERRHLQAQADLAASLGMSRKNILMLHNGDVLELNDKKAQITGKVPAGGILVDGLGVGDVGQVVIRDRQKLSEEGIMVVVMTLEKATGELIAGPEIVSRGFVYIKEAEALLDEADDVAAEAVDYCLRRGIHDWSKIKNTVKEDLSEFIWKKTKRRPMILPIILEA